MHEGWAEGWSPAGPGTYRLPCCSEKLKDKINYMFILFALLYVFQKILKFKSLNTTVLLNFLTYMHYLSVSLTCRRVRQAWSGVTRAGRRGGRQGGGGEGWSNEGPATGVSSQRGWRNWRSIQSHTAHTALDLFSPQLRVLLFLLNQPDTQSNLKYARHVKNWEELKMEK